MHLQRLLSSIGVWGVSTFLALATTTRFAHADKAELEALLEQPLRPTMEQVLKAAGPELTNPYADLDISRFDTRYKAQLEQIDHMPRVIAYMEKAFPGAIWAPLGRDAVIFGDLLDAFYLSIGQPGRVRRLNASGPSFAGHGIKELDSLRVRLMESAGLNLKDVAHSSPFVALDRTGYRGHSQSTLLLKAAYAAYVQSGGAASDLIRHVNFMSLESSSPLMGMDVQSIDLYFAPTSGPTAPIPSYLLKLNVGDWTDSLPWHDIFGPLAEVAVGRVEGPPGRLLGTLDQRRAILSEMIEILSRVSQPKFHDAVQKSAQALGIVLIPGRPLPVPLLPGERRIAENYRADRMARFQKLNLEQIYALGHEYFAYPEYTEAIHRQNAEVFGQWIQSERETQEAFANLAPIKPELLMQVSPSEGALFALDGLIGALERGLFSGENFDRMLAQCFAWSNGDDEFLEGFLKHYQKSPELRRHLGIRGGEFLGMLEPQVTERLGAKAAQLRELFAAQKPNGCAAVFGRRFAY